MVYFTIVIRWITSRIMEKLIIAEVILMAKKPNKTAAGTNAQHVKQQNQQAAQGQSQYGTEFASETNAQEVKQQNQKSAQQASQQASQNQGQYGTEFASETDAQKVKKQNQKSQQNKK